MIETVKNLYHSLTGNKKSRIKLNIAARKYQTDKINEHHSFAGKNYLDIYDIYFNPFKDKKIKLLEIGVREGSSLRTFRDYFTRAVILGIDINPETAFTEHRIKTYIGSQTSEKLINQIYEEHGPLEIILDDGSHVNELTIKSFNLLFDKLAYNGLYIIEDLACTYLEDNLKSDITRGGWQGMNLNDPSIEMVNHRSDMNSFFQNLIKNLDHRIGDVEYIHFWSQICVIKKISKY